MEMVFTLILFFGAGGRVGTSQTLSDYDTLQACAQAKTFVEEAWRAESYRGHRIWLQAECLPSPSVEE